MGGSEKLRKVKAFLQLLIRNLGLFFFKLLLLAHYEARKVFVHGTGRMGRRDAVIFIEQRQEASTSLHTTP